MNYELEITEMATITNLEEARNMLNILHKMGIKLSIDDFGSGYSTLNRLKQLPIDTIKIDKSFVQDIIIPHSLFHEQYYLSHQVCC